MNRQEYDVLRTILTEAGIREVLDVVTAVFRTSQDAVTDIVILKKGMTNRSFLFSVNGEQFIMRIPGEGTDRLINRCEEAAVYEAIAGMGICDEPVYMNPENGYKITRFLAHTRTANAERRKDVKCCMKKLRSFHELNLHVEHDFDLFGQIEFYEKLWEGKPSVYQDYRKTKENVYALKRYIDSQDKPWTLTHIDAVPDNFLFYAEDGREKLQLTDWEYAGMQDPHVDLAMFCIYSFYERDQVDKLIDIYFDGQCDRQTRTKIYCYISTCGLLWSNWCEYKRSLGVEFGEYSLRQYCYAKDYYRVAIHEIENMEKGSGVKEQGE